jgi:predicted acyl esterase
VLLVGGWVDRYSNTVMNVLAQNPSRCWGVVGPWGHHYPDVGRPGPGIGFQQEAVRWWDRWLRGIENGVDREPRLRVWMQEYAAPFGTVDIRPGRWVSERTWPPEHVASQDFWLSTGRLQRAPSHASAMAVIPTALEVGAAAGDTGYFGREGGLATGQGDDDACSLVFETEPLEEALEILGAVRLVISLESDQPVASLCARLSDVPPSGEISRVTYAVRNLALEEDGAVCRPLVSNEVRSFSVAFANTAYRFERGHRVRLALSSSYWPLIWPSPRPTVITVHLASTCLALPVRDNAFDALVSFSAPSRVEDTRVRTIAAPRIERWMENDAKTNHRSIQWHQPFTCVRLGDIGLDFGFETRAEHGIKLEDPTSACTRFEHRLYFSRGDWTVEILGIAELTSTQNTFNPCGSLEVRENGRLIFQRRWSPILPRTCS